MGVGGKGAFVVVQALFRALHELADKSLKLAVDGVGKGAHAGRQILIVTAALLQLAQARGEVVVQQLRGCHDGAHIVCQQSQLICHVLRCQVYFQL